MNIDLMEYPSNLSAQSAYIGTDISNFQCYSEDTIISQGTYSLKALALITNSLNDTLTKTFNPVLNLSAESTIFLDSYASRTGSNIRARINNIPSSDVKLLLPLNGVDGATATIDQSQSANAITFNGAAALDTAQKYLGTSSVLLDGNADFLSIGDAAWQDFGTGDFKIILAVRWNDHTSPSGDQCLLDLGGYAGGIMWYHSNNNSQFEVYVKGTLYTFSATVVDDTWYYMELTRVSGSMYLWQNGTQIGSTESVTDDLTGLTQGVYIGHMIHVGADRGVNGWIDIPEITNTAGHTTSYTPPTTPSNSAYFSIPISSANTWETKEWSISSLPSAQKGAIDELQFEIIEAGAENTFYLDNVTTNFAANVSPSVLAIIGSLLTPSASGAANFAQGSVLSLIGALLTPSANTGATISPSTLALILAQKVPSIITGTSVTVSPSVIALLLSLNNPTLPPQWEEPIHGTPAWDERINPTDSYTERSNPGSNWNERKI